MPMMNSCCDKTKKQLQINKNKGQLNLLQSFQGILLYTGQVGTPTGSLKAFWGSKMPPNGPILNGPPGTCPVRQMPVRPCTDTYVFRIALASRLSGKTVLYHLIFNNQKRETLIFPNTSELITAGNN